MKNNFIKKVITIALATSMFAVSLCGCQKEVKENRVKHTDNLLAGVQKSETSPNYNFEDAAKKPENYESYISDSCTLGLNMLKTKDYDSFNTITAPLSVTVSLSALANGTAKDTLKELKSTLGKSSYTNDVFNQCGAYITQKLSFFNNENTGVYDISSVWVKDEYSPKRSFLQKYENFYKDVFVYKADFASSNINQVINNFGFDNTKEIITSKCINTSADYQLYLDTAVAVSDVWLTDYEKDKVKQGDFTTAMGEAVKVNYLTSVERSFSNKDVTGFVKDLKNVPCKMVFIMPNEDVTLEKYVAELKAENFLALLQDMKPTDFVNASVPEFTISESTSIKDCLQEIGVKEIFLKSADFSKGFAESVYVNDFTQSVSISLTEKGVSSTVETDKEETQKSTQQANVDLKLNRPFVYAVVDNESYAPIIMGTVTNPTEITN